MAQWEYQLTELMERLISNGQKIVFAAHSMGTLLALEKAMDHPNRVAQLFLMDVPLYVAPRPVVFKNALRVGFDRVPEHDPKAQATRDACSIAPDCRVWLYAGWVPRYLELFAKIRQVRNRLPALQTFCRVFQSREDELVSIRAFDLLRKHPSVEARLLNRSGHFDYGEIDQKILRGEFSAMCREVNQSLS